MSNHTGDPNSGANRKTKNHFTKIECSSAFKHAIGLIVLTWQNGTPEIFFCSRFSEFYNNYPQKQAREATCFPRRRSGAQIVSVKSLSLYFYAY